MEEIKQEWLGSEYRSNERNVQKIPAAVNPKHPWGTEHRVWCLAYPWILTEWKKWITKSVPEEILW